MGLCVDLGEGLNVARGDLGEGGGGGGGRTPPSSGIRPPADPKGPPFDTFSEIHFWPTDPKIFLKAPWAPIYTNFGGARAKKKRNFFVKIFQKVAFLTVFSKICLRCTKFCQYKGKTVLWESSKNQFGRPKKKKGRQNFGKFFENPPPPPLEKILDPPLNVAHTFLDGSCLGNVGGVTKVVSAQGGMLRK